MLNIRLHRALVNPSRGINNLIGKTADEVWNNSIAHARFVDIIKSMWLKHQVICVRGRRLNNADLVVFGQVPNRCRWRISAAVILLTLGVQSIAAQISPSSKQSQPLSEQQYPVRPIRVIDAFSPGGGTDIMARMIGEKLTEKWGRPIVVENRPGASGIIGCNIAAKATADGYTLLMGSATSIIINPVTTKVPYDPVKDFVPVVWATSIPLMVVVHPSVPASSTREFIALAKSRPAAFNYGSGGQGSFGQLAGELFKVKTGIQLTHVPYKGAAPALAALVGAEVQLVIENMLPALPYVRSNRLRALAVTGPARSPAAPEIPTVIESGIAGYEALQWTGLLAPAGIPTDIVLKLNREIDGILKAPNFREPLLRQGAETVGGDPVRLRVHIAAEIDKWRKVIKDAGLRFE
jgi:tripartite-type tricarboxylate transporter receptor subunit TctC